MNNNDDDDDDNDESIKCLHYCINNNLLACLKSNTIIQIWNLNNYKCINTIITDEQVECIHLINDSLLAIGYLNKLIKIWNIKDNADNQCINTLFGHANSVRKIDTVNIS